MQHGAKHWRERLDAGQLRDRSAQSRFETFLFAAVATVLITRAYLTLAGFPQIGGGELHVAHAVWGGLLMGLVIVALVISRGNSVKMRGALLGGIGFGLFIDEIGKFVTRDVDYFFEPTIAIMYLVFVAFYLGVRAFLQFRRLTDSRRLATGLDALSDQARGQLRQPQRDLAMALIDDITDTRLSSVAAKVRAALANDATGKTRSEHRLARWRDSLSLWVDSVLAGRATRRIVLGFFIVQAALSVAQIIYFTVRRAGIESGEAAGSVATISNGVVTGLVIVGVVLLLRDHYLAALRLLRAAIVINLLVGQVFLFASEQFGALTGFAISLVMLAVLRRAIRQEELLRVRSERLGSSSAAHPEPSH